MEPYDLPTLDGLHLVQGLCDGVLLGAESLAGFPSLQTIRHRATLGYHGVNIHGSESRNKSMVIHVKNPHEYKKTQEVAEEMVGQRVFIGWPFLREGKVTAISDSLFKYEKMEIIRGASEKVIQTPHPPHGVGLWKSKSEKIETYYSKRCGVITGDIDVLVHIVPLKGLLNDSPPDVGILNIECYSGMRPLDDGAFVKEYEAQDKETEQAAQMTITSVTSEDPRYIERVPPPLSEEFPVGTKVFFLGEHAYGTAAQISGTTDATLSVVLAVSGFLYYGSQIRRKLSDTVLRTRQGRKRKVQRARQEPSWREVLPLLRGCKDRRTLVKSDFETHLQGYGSRWGPRKGQPRAERQV